MVSYRFNLVEYLHWMYVYEFLISTDKPGRVTSLGTLLYPFQFFVWVFTIASAMAVLLSLTIAQMLWLSSSITTIESNYTFEGNAISKQIYA